MFHREAPIVSMLEALVFEDFDGLPELDIELIEDFGDPSQFTANVCARGGHLDILRLSELPHVVLHSPGERVHHCTGRAPEGSRIQQRAVVPEPSVLTITGYSATLAIWNSWLRRCRGRILVFGTQCEEACSLEWMHVGKTGNLATAVFCWILMTTAACLQADTSDSGDNPTILLLESSRAAKL